MPGNKIFQTELRKSLPVTGLLTVLCFLSPLISTAQLKWNNADTLYAPLPSTVHIFKTNDSLDGKPFIAYYAEALLADPKLEFTTDTTFHRRFTPKQFYEKNSQPLLVVNCSFFNFDKHQNLNVIIKKGRLLAYNVHSIALKGRDTFQYKHPLGSAIGISKKRKADIAWLYTDSSKKYPYAMQVKLAAIKDSVKTPDFDYINYAANVIHNNYSRPGYRNFASLKKWKMQTAVGGGPVLVQEGMVNISNEEELKFTGKAISDKHPRTAMGYTKDGKLIILLIQGRFPGIAEGATLEQEARILISLGCVEALNLDGGGSSCMLINGKETIRPSDKEGERAVPAVFIIK